MLKILSLMLVFTSAHAAIPVLGREGITGTLSREEYAQTLLAVKEGLDQEIVAPLSINNDKAWKLDKFSIGVGSSGEVGIGPFKFGSTLKQRFFYTR